MTKRRTPSGGKHAADRPDWPVEAGDHCCLYHQEIGIHLTPAELARRWRLSVRTLERWRAAQTGPAWLMMNGRIRYPIREVIAFERAHLRPARR